jgi:DNA primase
MEITPIPSDIYKWIRDRGIAPEVILSSRLSWDGKNIVIPVRDSNGKFLFNKYRKNPFDFSSTSPKYFYDAGHRYALYNAHILKDTDVVFIVEGELDVLLLTSLQIPAVSSTGGAMSFSIDWAPLFEGKEVFICYDADEAGVRGAIKVARMIPHAKIVWLPRGQFVGKDVTDFILDRGLKDFIELGAQAIKHNLPRDFDHVPEDKKDLVDKCNEFKVAIDEAMKIKRDWLHSRTPTGPMIYLISYLTERYRHYCERIKSFKRPVVTKYNEDRIFLARQVPISRFVDFNNKDFAMCIWHKEQTPSMKYNNFKSKYPNSIKCFACGEMGDVIDVVMTLKNVSFNEAINILLNK